MRAAGRALVGTLLVICSMLLLAACGNPSSYPATAPELAGADLDGQSRSLAEMRGDVVIVTVWASWCGPCRDEIPVLTAAQRELGPAGLRVLGINMRDGAEPARALIRQESADYPSIVDPDGTIAVEWGVFAIPMSFLVDRAGNVVSRHAGPVTQEWVDGVVAPVVRA